MIRFAQKIPSWALMRLPVHQARQCAINSLATLPLKKQATVSQLLVDVSVIYQNDARTGIQRVVRALLLQLLKSPPSGYRVCPVFATRHNGYCYACPDFLEKPRSANAGKLVEFENGDIFLALDLAAHLLPRHQAQLLQWKRAGVQLHVIVYDLLPLLHPEWFNPKTTHNFKRWIRWLAIYADNTICISQTVKTEVHTWLNARYGLRATDLASATISLGADIEASAPSSGLPANAEILLDHLRKTSYVLMVGTLEPRKGYDQALMAFEKLWERPDSEISLVLVGRVGWKTEALQKKLREHPEVGKRLFWLENVSDEFLEFLYVECSGVLVASRAEGFGLPLIEASMYGKPVLVRDLPVFREINAPALTYFNSGTAEALAECLLEWLDQIEEQVLTPAKNPAESIFPTWQLSAEQLLLALGFEEQIKNKDFDRKKLAHHREIFKL